MMSFRVCISQCSPDNGLVPIVRILFLLVLTQLYTSHLRLCLFFFLSTFLTRMHAHSIYFLTLCLLLSVLVYPTSYVKYCQPNSRKGTMKPEKRATIENTRAVKLIGEST